MTCTPLIDDNRCGLSTNSDSRKDISVLAILWKKFLARISANSFSVSVDSAVPSLPHESVKMVLHNPNNWHWVSKDVSGWAKDWLKEKLSKIEAKEGDVSAKITNVVSMDGDVDVSQRKGKVITIYDVKLTLEYSGT